MNSDELFEIAYCKGKRESMKSMVMWLKEHAGFARDAKETTGSEKAFEKLQEEASQLKCRVIRNGKKIEIPVSEVVVNDIVVLETGDKIPADGVIVKGNITVDESTLNGETKEVYKDAALNVNNPKDKNIVYMGTVVYDYNAFMKVTKVGDETFYGKLSLELQNKQPDTPLKIRLRHLATIISKIGYIGAFLVFFSYLTSFFIFYF